MNGEAVKQAQADGEEWPQALDTEHDVPDVLPARDGPKDRRSPANILSRLFFV